MGIFFEAQRIVFKAFRVLISLDLFTFWTLGVEIPRGVAISATYLRPSVIPQLFAVTQMMMMAI